jgi:hypothetical protein
MSSQDNPSISSRDKLVEKLLNAAFERAAKGEPGRSPEQLMDLIEKRAEKARLEALTPAREEELRRAVEELGLTADENMPAVIRHINGLMAEKELDGTGDPKLRGIRYWDNPNGGENSPPPPPAVT